MSMFERTMIEKKERPEDPMADERRKQEAQTRKLCEEICVVIPHRPGEGIHPKTVEHVVQWVNAGVAFMMMRDTLGGHIDLLRAHMCHKFLTETSRKFLVMIDNDVIPQGALAPIQLCGHNLPVVSGIACSTRPGWGTFACVAVKDQSGVSRFPTTMDTKTMPAFGLRQITTCGAGILAIRRDVIEAILLREKPFKLPESVRDEACERGMLAKSEDIYFGYQVKKAGFDMFCDFAVQCFHDKMIPLAWPAESLDSDLDPEEWDVTSSAMAADGA